MMNPKIVLCYLFFLLFISLKAQDASNHDDFIYITLKEEINNYQKKSEEINVVLIDAPILLDGNNNFYERKQYIENVKINYTNLKKLNKGKSALLVYPIRVENNNLYIIIETIIVNKKRIEVTRKNTYYFYYNCGEKKYKLDNKIDFQ